MKQVFTCSLDEDLVQKIRERTRVSRFRNKSHLVEEAIRQFLEEQWEQE
ncbi:ribbon-helix-helix protein, CopG family [Candidatus Woesearchaeota archaeon]|nr:ribbon-helix-helix protein, CopG family [Candidatus Woesearchaeota archaeon]